MKLNKLTNILGVVALCLYFSIYLVPEENINNFLIVDIVVSLIFIILVLVSSIGLFVVFSRREQLTIYEKFFPFIGMTLYLSTGLIHIYAPPIVDVELTYLGQKPAIIVALTFGNGSSGFTLHKNKTFEINMGRATKGLRISWGEHKDDEKERIFDLSSDIPKYGSNLTLEIFILDEDASYKVRKKQHWVFDE